MKKCMKILVPLLFWCAVWWVAAELVGQELLLPGPMAVAGRLIELAGTAPFWAAAGVTLGRVFLGLLAGVLLGAGLAVLTCAFPWCDWLLTPAIKVIRATPVASFILLLLLWVARGQVPGVISTLMVLPVIWGNVAKGIGETDRQLLELCHTYGFGRWKTVRLLYMPSVWPYFSSGVQTSLGLAWKAGVAAEVLCLPKLAIGTQVYYSKIYLETPDLFAWTVVVIGLSFLVEVGVKRVLKLAER